ncbi:unnamed protein product [Mytilus edulis]|uniref:Uncharacterized protein n=2 Tax=Mytilus TaxID=6548 RepID=A0A8B6FCN5_MYTGA|nr:unnamed protein product [Mytilus edulis]VDI46150.1 Hypothetical predicted protein [Mytilus galloprovincialis]
MTKDKECELLTFNFEPTFLPPSPSDERTDVSLLPVSSTDGCTSYNGDVLSVPTGKNDKRKLSESRNGPPNYLGLALFVTLCNCPFGSLAILFAILSRRQYASGEIVDAKQKGTISKWLSILGVAATLLLIAFLLVYKFVILPNVVVDLKALQEQLKN